MTNAVFITRLPLTVPEGASTEEKLTAACHLADELDLHVSEVTIEDTEEKPCQ